MAKLFEAMNHAEGYIHILEDNGENLTQHQVFDLRTMYCTFDVHMMLLLRDLVWTFSTGLVDAAR